MGRVPQPLCSGGYPGGPYLEAEPCWLPKEEVLDLAGQLTETWGYSPGGELEAVIAKLGGRISYRDEVRREDGSIIVHGPRNFVIHLFPYIGERRNRFTLAHELGHYILHSQFGDKPIRVNREGSTRVEWEANWFASGFLMPQRKFLPLVRQGWSEGRLADYFQVSEAAVQIRKESL